MNRFALAALAATILALPAAAADISGSWTLNGDVVGNAISMNCVFKQADDKVTGTCSGQFGSAQTEGKVAENNVTFTHSVDNGQVYELTYTGTLDATGTSMQGDIAVAGVTGTFTAKKDATSAPAAPATAAAAAPADFAGSWTFNGDVVGNTINMKCTFRKDGDKYTGTCSYQGLGDSPTTGTVSGSKVTFENQVQREQLYDLTYVGELDSTGSAIKGDIQVAGVTGTFAGSRDK